MNTFSLHISIVLLAVIAVINCFPGGFDVNDEMAEQQYDPPQPSISQLLQLIEEKAVNQQDPENEIADQEGNTPDDENEFADQKGNRPDQENEFADEEGNRPDHGLHVQCNAAKGEALTSVKSVYSAGHRDRSWDWSCTKVSTTPMSECKWTGYLNNWDQPLLYSCPKDFVMGGIISYHNNGKEDRRWRVKCCRAKGYQTKSCELTPNYINGFRARIDFKVEQGECVPGEVAEGRAFAGLSSLDDNRYHDRRWKIYQCSYGKKD